MAEPQRWLTDRTIGAGLRSALEAAAEPPPLPPELHAKLTTYTVGLATQGVLAKVAAGGLWQRLLQTFSSSKALVLVSLVGAAGLGSFGALYAVVPSPPPPAARPAPSRALSFDPKPAPPQQLVAAPAVTPTLAPPDPAVRPRVSTNGVGLGDDAAGHLIPLAAESASSGTSGIAEEARLLERARSALQDTPALAFELTEQHRQLGPTAQLSAEREFIAIEALLRLGRRAEAERRAAPRLEQAPDSVYTRRLRSLFSEAAPPTTKSTNP
jgi:hypothetical protein